MPTLSSLNVNPTITQMAQTSNLNAADRIMLEKNLKEIEETKKRISDCMTEDEALSRQETVLRKQLKQVSSRRKQLRKTIEEYHVTLTRMEGTVDHLKNKLSPVRSLPSEVLLRIFRECILQEPEDFFHEVIEGSRYASSQFMNITLGSVCSRWRTVVKQNAKLWDFILIDEPTNKEGQKRMVRHWMAHGSQNRQSIVINPYSDTVRSFMLSTVGSSYSPLWKSITLGLHSPQSIEQRWDIEELRASEVSIYCDEELELDFLSPLIQYASKVVCTGYPPILLDTSWNSLKSLTIHPLLHGNSSRFRPLDLLYLLMHATFLESLELAFTKAHIDLYYADSPILMEVEHRNLKSLSIPLHHMNADGGLFGIRIIAPSLLHLGILSFDDLRIKYAPPLEFICEGITSFTLCKISGDQVSSVVEFLKCLPNVTTIDVQGHRIDALFHLINEFYRDVPPQHPHLPIPKLSTLVMFNTDIRGATLVKLASLKLAQIEGETPGISSMTEIRLHDNDLVSPVEWKQVGHLLEKGRQLGSGSSGCNDHVMS